MTSYQFGNESRASHAVADERYRLIRYGNGFEELYDFQEDPHEFTNRIDDPTLKAVRRRLTGHLPVNPAQQVDPVPDSPYNLKKRKTTLQGIAQKAFEVSFRVHPHQDHADGVLVSNGGNINGYTVYLKDGKPVFGVRMAGKLTAITSARALPGKPSQISARLNLDGEMILSLNGQVAATGKAGGLIPKQPNEGFTLRADPRTPVGDYQSPFSYQGGITKFQFRELKENEKN